MKHTLNLIPINTHFLFLSRFLYLIGYTILFQQAHCIFIHLLWPMLCIHKQHCCSNVWLLSKIKTHVLDISCFALEPIPRHIHKHHLVVAQQKPIHIARVAWVSRCFDKIFLSHKRIQQR